MIVRWGIGVCHSNFQFIYFQRYFKRINCTLRHYVKCLSGYVIARESSQLLKQLKFWFTLKCCIKTDFEKYKKNWTANTNDFSCCGRTSKEAIHRPLNVSDGYKSFQYSCKKGMSWNHKAAGNRALICFMFTLFWHDFHHLTVIL